MKKTIKDLLSERETKLTNKTFLFWEDDQVSYSKMLETAKKIASSLADKGINKDDKICIWLTNRPEFIYSMFGAAFAGAVLVPINTQFKLEEAQYILENSEAKMLITQPEFAEMAAKIRPQCKNLKEFVVVDQAPAGTTPFSELYKPPKMVERKIEEEDIAGIIYTSGTTGYPKGVLLTHKNYWTNASQISQAAKMTEADRFMCILPALPCQRPAGDRACSAFCRRADDPHQGLFAQRLPRPARPLPGHCILRRAHSLCHPEQPARR